MVGNVARTSVRHGLKFARIAYWLGGLAAAALGALLVVRFSTWNDAGPLVLLLAWAMVGLAGELLAAVLSMRSAPRPPLPRNAQPADGVVDIAAMAGVERALNERDTQYGRFLAWKPDTAAVPQAILGTRRCPPLLGRVVLFSLFIGRDGAQWSEAEIAQAHDAMRKAGLWLEREAMRWNAPVNLALADTYFVASDDTRDDVEVTLVPHGDRLVPADAHEPTKLLAGVSRAAAGLGFRDAVDWLAQTTSRLEADVRVCLVHMWRSGCSQVVTEHDTDRGTVRLAVCYGRETLFPEPLVRTPYIDPTTVAHEVLHLFAATDKYEVELSRFPAKSVTSRDIMRLSHGRLSQLRIDPMTAAEIGWS
jgi:hypothetical protein